MFYVLCSMSYVPQLFSHVPQSTCYSDHLVISQCFTVQGPGEQVSPPSHCSMFCVLPLAHIGSLLLSAAGRHTPFPQGSPRNQSEGRSLSHLGNGPILRSLVVCVRMCMCACVLPVLVGSVLTPDQ